MKKIFSFLRDVFMYTIPLFVGFVTGVGWSDASLLPPGISWPDSLSGLSFYRIFLILFLSCLLVSVLSASAFYVYSKYSKKQNWPEVGD